MQVFALSNLERWAVSPALQRLWHCAVAGGVCQGTRAPWSFPVCDIGTWGLGGDAGRMGKSRSRQPRSRQPRSDMCGALAGLQQRVCVCIRTAGDVAQADMRLANVLQTPTSQEGNLALQKLQASLPSLLCKVAH